MTGIIRFPRGGRPSKVTKPPAAAPPTSTTNTTTRRAVSGRSGGNSSHSGAAPSFTAADRRELAFEQAFDMQLQERGLFEDRQRQQRQPQGQEQHGTAAPTETETADHLSPVQAQSLIQDGPFYNPDHGQAHTTDDDTADGDHEEDRDRDRDRDDNSGKPGRGSADSDMLDVHGGGENRGASGASGGHSGDINEAEMSEMVGDAVNSYTGENGAGMPPRTIEGAGQPTSNATTSNGNSHGHGIDMDLSAAAAAAAAAAAVASASHLATSGQNHTIDHQLHARTADYSSPTQVPDAQMSDAQHPQHSQHSLPSTAENTALDTVSGQEATEPVEAPKHDPAAPTASAPAPARSSTADLARDSGYDHLVVESALAKRLSREVGLRPAQQRRPDQQLNLGRRSNVEALFAHISGAEVAVPCKNCHKGHGPWTACVVVDGQMCGSCANCWFNASGARCSFHETKATPLQGHLHGHPSRPSVSGGVAPSPSASMPSALDPQLAAAAGAYTVGSPLGGGTNVHHPFSAQQQHQQHQQLQQLQPHAAPAQQAAAAAAAAAVAVQQLSNGGHFPGVAAATNGTSGASRSGDGSLPSPLNLDLVSALLSSSPGGHERTAAAATATADAAPLVSLVINQALAEVRNADQRGRDLMLVEIAAKQLALAIVRYGEGASAATTAGAAGSAPSDGSAASVVVRDGASAAKGDAASSSNKDGTGPDVAE
ncbi:uncharacterized protein SPSK_03124 [Sporothrix schenckii 1099-18]|uniref:Uncharacterized protein n=1 Tax=Sporothrix schenckii 1099-18 TaxID=1397361 RepID=A0A0F2M0B2_SPOSC|nr:uncharacterized protein SPSK_03124 [Sporothrix schenckii 1099-18]KJR82509.1 hypothetical protein SPSK_03124 [Sporothrix schenckii 1099-18]